MELRVGDPELKNPMTRTGAIDWPRLQRSFRFGFGLTGLFLSTVALTLAVLAMVAMVVPRWHSTVVASESMEPALQRGDTVLYSEQDLDEVGVGTVVVFDSNDVSVIHRVVDVNPDGTLVTRGDANQSNDSSPVTASELFGAGRVVVPWVGMVRLWWLDGRHELVVATLMVFLIALRGAGLSSERENDPWDGTESTSPSHSWLWSGDLDDESADNRLLGEPQQTEVVAALTLVGGDTT
ncbi:signal peptidase I [Ilumatobacter coccineus]|nr:signal peptidase I [Ilumatobacter coccineus]